MCRQEGKEENHSLPPSIFYDEIVGLTNRESMNPKIRENDVEKRRPRSTGAGDKFVIQRAKEREKKRIYHPEIRIM